MVKPAPCHVWLVKTLHFLRRLPILDFVPTPESRDAAAVRVLDGDLYHIKMTMSKTYKIMGKKHGENDPKPISRIK